MADSNADLVSVIIPTYNRSALLLQAVASVRQQTWPHVQIIVADDGSDDNTAEIMSRATDVLYVRQEHRGQGAARNLGLRHADGAFICSLDSDDLWDPDFLESSLRALRTLKADFVFSNWKGQTADGESFVSNFEEIYGWRHYRETELKGWLIMEPEQARAIYVDACISPSSSFLLPRELLENGWAEDLKIADDWDLLLGLVLSKPRRVAVSSHPRWRKRVFGDNICDQRSSKDVKRYLCVHDFHILLKRFAPMMSASERSWYYARLAFYQLVLARWELAERNIAVVPGLLIRAIGCMLFAFLLFPGIVLKCVREVRSRKHSTSSQVRRRRQAVLETAKRP
ncbi:hypothetical protein CCAX7_32020 [Capsulimonas corticalis]|uniref:Uncharacterized protein n=1 Tax=Capsulimonas corticalis TaxID=2219043 RepID=A0A402D435_9BACT|nr:glycosyltransferase family 2 protein [Capsulimonas corticalis]BDI31151.1 hypothetical protein CCAX7_32020 [Capsulimonas corticalis]